jgi:hypothetical protein
MHLIVEVLTGPLAGKKVDLRPGKIIQVGRTSWADLSLPHDSFMSSAHFTLEGGHDQCRLRDQKSTNGTLLNGVRVSEAVIKEGDQITAGQTTFQVRSAATVFVSPPATEPAVPEAPAPKTLEGESLPEILRRKGEPLFALLDAARDPKIPLLLRNCKEERQTLYEGVEAGTLADFAPYLVRLPPDSPLLETLMAEGWGKSWGVYLRCSQSLKEIRRHFRHFLMVKTEAGKELYFRFYDPRVLRTFLPTCTPAERQRLFGPVSSFLLEAEEAVIVLEFVPGQQKAQKRVLSF